MGIREKLEMIEELEARKSTVTLSADGGVQNGAELCVENCRCVKELSEELIVLSVCGMDIRVAGSPLTLGNFGVGSIRITGSIRSLTFEPVEG